MRKHEEGRFGLEGGGWQRGDNDSTTTRLGLMMIVVLPIGVGDSGDSGDSRVVVVVVVAMVRGR